jgi:exo-beta-1,3-glucanase (GH17 family)
LVKLQNFPNEGLYFFFPVETGWPTQGGPNGLAVPGVENQKKAIRSILETQGQDLILFTAFNEGWKKDNPNTHGAEKVR